jgi:tetratricopeptide (TPR) repeat protein
MVRGTAAFKGAKSVADYRDAAKEFEQATHAAPWYGDAYLNLGVAQDKAENYEGALRSLKLALLALPNDKEIKALIYEVEYRKEKAQATPKTGESFRDCVDCPEMVVLPAGGTIGRSFAMGKYEVTQGQWHAVMGNNPSHHINCGDNCPVEQVNWNDAQAFIQKLNGKTGKQYRLPSEAEWEYACRTGSGHEYCGSDNPDSVAWWAGSPDGWTHPVGRKQPNAFGLYDMIGNVWEWVEDCYKGDCAVRVLRGGSVDSGANYLRFPEPYRSDPGGRDDLIRVSGFRVARTLP